jgi:hypothetical protein
MSDLRAAVGHSTAASTDDAISRAVRAALEGLGGARPALALLSATVEHDAAALLAALRRELPGVPVHGATSSLGVLAGSGIISAPSGAVGVMLLSSAAEGRFAVGGAAFDEAGGAAAAGRKAAEAVLAGMGGLRPGLLLIAASPGEEEAVMAGIESVLPGVPMYGGSAADHAIEGAWWVFTNDGPRKSGVSLAGIGGGIGLGSALVAPYEATARSAKVTELAGGSTASRSIASLDGRAAMAVLDEWTGHTLTNERREGGNLLMQTALMPLGVAREREGGGRFYQLLHPAQAHTSGAFDVFASVAAGTTLSVMHGTQQGLVDTVDKLVAQALEDGGLKGDDVKAAVFYYCAGCAGAVGGRLNEAIARVGAMLPAVPVLGFCTFGEEGHVGGLGSMHTNLSLVLTLLS